MDGDSSEYFCSIVRFTIQTGNTLPVLIPRIADPMYPNTTIYSVSFRYRDKVIENGREFIVTAPIIYEPEDRTAMVSKRPTARGQDLSGTYYHVHNYTHFISLVNKAL